MRGSEELKKQVLPSIAAGEAMASYALSERGRRQRRRGHAHPGARGRRRLGAQRVQVLDLQRRQVHLVHRDGGDRPRQGSPTASRRSWCTRTIPGSSWGPRNARWASRARPPRSCTSRTAGSRATGSSVSPVPGSRPPWPPWITPARRSARRPSVSRRVHWTRAIAYIKERKQFGKPIGDFQAVQFMLADMAMKLEAARLMVYTAAARAERGESNLGFLSAASKCFASDVAMEVTTDAVQLFGGVRLHRRLPGRAVHARCQDHPDLRGHQPDSARRDGAQSAQVAG